MADLVQRITEELKRQIDLYQPTPALKEVKEVGVVTEAGDGVVWIEGPDRKIDVASQDMVEFQTEEGEVRGIIVNMGEAEERFRVEKGNEHKHPYLDARKITLGATVIIGDHHLIKQGTRVYATGERASVGVGEALIGRVINARGEPVDGRGEILLDARRPIESPALGVVERADVDTPVQTGIKAIDAMIPIGRGQRELIIGDRQTGKSAIAIDTIINQKGKDLICIYVAIGQKKAAVARTVATLKEHGAMDHTIVIVAAADESVAMQYIAPYVGATIGEYFMEQGRDALVVYDDLSKHAWAYRQVSLLLRRPPGREAYPGDIFYLHSRLLERAARRADQYVIVQRDFAGTLATRQDSVNGVIYDGPRARHDAETAIGTLANPDEYRPVKLKGSGGSLTALPIVETLQGDVSAYIPTNVISITDGQIYLESNLFNAGIRPAINVGISVSRVGGDAQTQAMKQVAARLRLDMAAYRELAAFAQFGSDLDKATQAQIARGQRMQEILKQAQYEPMSLEDEARLLFAGAHGYADAVPVERMKQWETDLLRYLAVSHPEIGRDIAAQKRITVETEQQLREAVEAFQAGWS